MSVSEPSLSVCVCVCVYVCVCVCLSVSEGLSSLRISQKPIYHPFKCVNDSAPQLHKHRALCELYSEKKKNSYS